MSSSRSPFTWIVPKPRRKPVSTGRRRRQKQCRGLHFHRKGERRPASNPLWKRSFEISTCSRVFFERKLRYRENLQANFFRFTAAAIIIVEVMILFTDHRCGNRNASDDFSLAFREDFSWHFPSHDRREYSNRINGNFRGRSREFSLNNRCGNRKANNGTFRKKFAGFFLVWSSRVW